MLEEKDILQAAATMFAGIMQNNNIKVRFTQSGSGDINLIITADDMTGIKTNVATVMASIVAGIKQTELQKQRNL